MHIYNSIFVIFADSKLYSDIGINVSLGNDELSIKPEMQEKCVMTDEFYNLIDNSYPLLCAQCKIHLFPPPFKEICEMMSECPKLIEPIASPKKISPSTHLSSSK